MSISWHSPKVCFRSIERKNMVWYTKTGWPESFGLSKGKFLQMMEDEDTCNEKSQNAISGIVIMCSLWLRTGF